MPLLDGAKGKTTPTNAVTDRHKSHHSSAAVPNPSPDGTAMSTTTAVTNGVAGEHVGCSAGHTTKFTPMEECTQPEALTERPPGLLPPMLASTAPVTGATTPRLRIENKRKRKKLQAAQPQQDWWTVH